jgi:bacteriochlorophyll 4-vinyl reductase
MPWLAFARDVRYAVSRSGPLHAPRVNLSEIAHMNDAGVGRLLVASLHQGIADVLPTRLDFYESWLNPAGLRDGKIGLAPMAAVLSFLRQEGELYPQIARRAGEYTAEWMVAALPPLERRFTASLPPRLRLWYVMRLARRLVRQSYSGSRAIVRLRGGVGAVDLRGSLFCQVREPTPQPLCHYYAAAIGRLASLFDIHLAVDTDGCRATGAPKCLFALSPRPEGGPQ